MAHVLEGREGRVGKALADALGDVGAGDRVEHAPDEGERDVGRLQRADPALLVARGGPPCSGSCGARSRRPRARGLPDVRAVGGPAS